MKRLLVAALALTLSTGLIAGLGNNTVRAAGPKIGLVTDVGQVDDRSFNQSAWDGAQLAAKELGGTADYIETKGPEDYANNIALFADKDYDIIITVGFAMGEATGKAAAKYPDIHFIGVDQFQGAEVEGVTGLIFPEQNAGFLAGVLAARMSKSGIIGAVLGTDQVPPVVAFKNGYEAGAKFANDKIKLISTYHPGGLDKAFVDPEWGAATAAQAIDQGADVIFGAGGKTGNGALEEIAKRTTKEKPVFCIGVDTDQWETVPAAQPCLISSATKDIVDGVVAIAKLVAEDKAPAGNYLGTAGLAPYHDFEKVIPAEVQKEIADLTAQLISGELVVKFDGTVEKGMAMEATAEATPAK